MGAGRLFPYSTEGGLPCTRNVIPCGSSCRCWVAGKERIENPLVVRAGAFQTPGNLQRRLHTAGEYLVQDALSAGEEAIPGRFDDAHVESCVECLEVTPIDLRLEAGSVESLVRFGHFFEPGFVTVARGPGSGGQLQHFAHVEEFFDVDFFGVEGLAQVAGGLRVCDVHPGPVPDVHSALRLQGAKSLSE
jgi:hypothetical protein